MKNVLVLGAFSALATGMAIGIQAAFSSRIGGVIGPSRTGLLTNLFSGVVAGALLILVYSLTRAEQSWQIPGGTWVMLIISGALGILVITGVSFSLQRTGVTAGLAAILMGQLLVGLIVDTTGLGGADPIPFEFRRVLGLGVMALAIYLLLPRS